MEPLLLKDEPMVFEGFMKICMNIVDADGILVNTWQELEPTTLKALLSGEAIRGKIYPVGLLVRGINSNRTEKDHDLVLSWLDRQPAESVIFVSFGSGGTMSEALMEVKPLMARSAMAYVLELSQQRFIWVVRPPHKEKTSANHGSYFKLEYGENNTDSLLEKFLSRTHELGLMVPMWAPQLEILEHSSVGAFMSHCGWNSMFEAITNGVPMIAWQLYAEQKMNAAALTEEMGVAVRVKRGGNKAEVVKREEIQRLTRRVMVEEQGVYMRERVKKLQRGAKMTLSEAGSSFDSIYQLANYCKTSSSTFIFSNTINMVLTVGNPSVALLCSPGIGHLIPMLELGKCLMSNDGFDVTIFIVTTDSSTTHSQIVHQTSSNPKTAAALNVIVLPPVDVSSKLKPLNSSQFGARIRLTMEEALPLLRSAFLSMKLRPIALIVDLFGTDAFAMARDLEMLTYVFFTSSAWVLALAVHVPVMEKELLDRHVKLHEPLPIPGCKPLRFEDTMEPLLLKD
ncbi:UDP-glycosyltransferase 72E2-like [Neltuma alba]|uniref:UDP-glycosyltransferase 72E2-like n=1 Tax=Neltuma alba TaxID=207710 RepID=UPI0010A39E08|nr:UDP-glycosyltransferase 72E2-like [Prosopis alba]